LAAATEENMPGAEGTPKIRGESFLEACKPTGRGGEAMSVVEKFFDRAWQF